jgi:hypothetical protein
MKTIGEQVAGLDEQLAELAAPDPGRVAALTQQKAVLEAQREWLNMRFDEMVLRR